MNFILTLLYLMVSVNTFDWIRHSASDSWQTSHQCHNRIICSCECLETLLRCRGVIFGSIFIDLFPYLGSAFSFMTLGE